MRNRSEPLALRMRPRTIDDIVGQAHVIGPKTPLYKMVKKDMFLRYCCMGTRDGKNLARLRHRSHGWAGAGCHQCDLSREKGD